MHICYWNHKYSALKYQFQKLCKYAIFYKLLNLLINVCRTPLIMIENRKTLCAVGYHQPGTWSDGPYPNSSKSWARWGLGFLLPVQGPCVALFWSYQEDFPGFSRGKEKVNPFWAARCSYVSVFYSFSKLDHKNAQANKNQNAYYLNVRKSRIKITPRKFQRAISLGNL